MSEVFHKSYTSRKAAYNYRTLSTNTVDRKRSDIKEDSSFDRKFRELKGEIISRITKEVDQCQLARKSIQEKLDKVEKKINDLLEVNNVIFILNKDLRVAENILVDTMEKVEKIEHFVENGKNCSLRSKKSSFANPSYVFNT